MSGGANAVLNSENFIKHVTSIDPLRNPNKYTELSSLQKKYLQNAGFNGCPLVNNGSPFYTTNVRIAGASNIYNSNAWQLNVFIWHPQKFPRGIAIRCNWQQTTGTTDEKHPFNLISLEKVVNENNLDLAVFLVDGTAAKQSAKDWIMRYAHNHKLLRFTSMSAWANWAKTNL